MLLAFRCRANKAYTRQFKPDSGLGFQVQVLQPFECVPFSLVESGTYQIDWEPLLGVMVKDESMTGSPSFAEAEAGLPKGQERAPDGVC
jgi:hypothetical protein